MSEPAQLPVPTTVAGSLAARGPRAESTDAVTHVVVDALDTGKPYSTATIAHGFVFLSGLIPTAPTGDVAQMSLREQITAVWRDAEKALRACGATTASIVRCTCYLVDPDSFAEFNEVYGEQVAPPYPARTTVVTQLAAPGVLFEMDVVAALDQSRVAVGTP